MLVVADAVVGANDWLVLSVANLVKAGDDWRDEVGSESATELHLKCEQRRGDINQNLSPSRLCLLTSSRRDWWRPAGRKLTT